MTTQHLQLRMDVRGHLHVDITYFHVGHSKQFLCIMLINESAFCFVSTDIKIITERLVYLRNHIYIIVQSSRLYM